MAQLQIDQSPVSATCNLAGYGPVTISAPREALTGDNISLNITLPGTIPANCVKTVTVTRSAELQYQGAGAIAFVPVPGDPQSHANSVPLVGNDGQNFNLFFRFPPYVTCNGTTGTLTVTVTVRCGEEEISCAATLTVTGRAANYWSLTKEFVSGNLTCGYSYWQVLLEHDNPNPPGLGTYSISGSITDSPGVPVVSGAAHSVFVSGTTGNHSYTYDVVLQNCVPEGSVINNVAEYELTLGNGCETMEGTVSANSPPIASPNASLSFTKNVQSASGSIFAEGCQGVYNIKLKNNGNVPWENIVITDDINIPGITFTGTSNLTNGWAMTNVGGVLTFTNPTLVLAPGQEEVIQILFTIDQGTPVGTIVTNVATVTYQAQGAAGNGDGGGGGTGPGGTACPGIDCPVIDTFLQNDTARATFEVDEAEARAFIKKCIMDPPNNFDPPLYQIGDIIRFRIMVGNTGPGALSAAVADALGASGQNLQLIPSSVQYEYFEHANATTALYTCNPNLDVQPQTPPFTVVPDLSDLQNPTWQVNGIPGSCSFNRGNFLAIYFDALVLPQLHGSKINTATVQHGDIIRSSSAAYAVDEVGILSVAKEADTQTVEAGQLFNYLIHVINNGSVPLNGITVADQLPDCAVLSGAVSAIDGQGTAVSVTAAGNLQLSVNPAYELQPGDQLTITVPVRKQGGGTCCNVSVSAAANMVTSGASLTAISGSEAEPAACVVSGECCDIPDFNASLVYRNGRYEVVIQGGATPIQEVEISMIGYDITYSAADCQPSDMGIFGMLSTDQTPWGNLVLNASDNHTGSLTWTGAPTVLDGSVLLDVSQPGVLDIECCEVEFAFCLKVRVKDVNCNVCEQTICFTPEDVIEPCTLEIEPIANEKPYCVGDVIAINWAGTVPSGTVNIRLVDPQTGVIQQVLATGAPGTGTLQFTIPDDFPCDPTREWMVVIQDNGRECLTRSNTFRIDCCHETACDCGEWVDHWVNVLEYEGPIPENPRARNVPAPSNGQRVSCGESIRLNLGRYYTFTAPEFACQPEGCEPNYTWEIALPDGSTLAGNGQTMGYHFLQPGVYNITFTPECGGVKCTPCTIQVVVRRIIGPVGPVRPASGVQLISF